MSAPAVAGVARVGAVALATSWRVSQERETGSLSRVRRGYHTRTLTARLRGASQEFERERELIDEEFTPLVLKCRELNRAIRIGTNHGSLSARILSYYGDTPR